MNSFLDDLRSVRGMTPELEEALIHHLEYYWPARRRDSTSSAERERQRDAVAGLQAAGRQLHKALRRADAAFAGRAPVDGLEAPLAQMLEQLERWVASQRQRRRRGRPQDIHRQALRLSVFHALAQHGITPTLSARGPAAQVLLLVFEEADRRDHNPPTESDYRVAERAAGRFNGKEWAGWVAEYQEDVALHNSLTFPREK
jgi:hypothetical protein